MSEALPVPSEPGAEAPGGRPQRTRWSPQALYGEQEERKRKRFLWWTPAWLCVAAAGFLSLLGVVAIGTTRPSMPSGNSPFS